MSRIGNVDQVLLLLREQLQRAGQTGGRNEVGKAAKQTKADQRPLDRARATAALQSIDPEERRRLVVRSLLAEEFGEQAAADPAFATIVDRVLGLVRDMPGGAELIDRALAQLGPPT